MFHQPILKDKYQLRYIGRHSMSDFKFKFDQFLIIGL